MQDHLRQVDPLREARPCEHATQTYHEWRQLGAAIEAALSLGAGQAANEQSEHQKRKGDDAP